MTDDVEVLQAQETWVAQVALVAAMGVWAALTDEERLEYVEVVVKKMTAVEILEDTLKIIEFAGFLVEPYRTETDLVGMYL